MRGIRVGIPAALALVLAVAGCANPGGVDGDLTNQWAPMASATGFEPNGGTCHISSFDPVGARGAYEEIGCEIQHRTETVYVGQYEAPAAEADEPPAADSAGAREAYRVCDNKTTAYVGGPWRTGRLWIGVVHPTPAAWTGGSRWYRCEVIELSSVEDDGTLVQRAGSLKNALASTGALTLGCYAVRQDSSGAIASMPAVACDAEHNAEFAGLWNAKNLAYPKRDAAWRPFHNGCREVVSGYAKVPDDKDLQYRTGVVSLPGSEDVWGLGDHSVRCYLWVDGAELTGTLKGKGTKSLPIQYK
ncbi:septum formation family protein [Actinoplanes sp. TBRC 11911]|uniref:septum formation family protein n=1 Tax=Actinoplanes sp. TBRC 11911 TaxID=2729386 RepID=UPI00145F37E6|nr:septum formation family protein [Actinoplanes sp. TBRC 11911]NMO52156.1 septum formation family protein [Actinoplanes sp. TBRC 11911]